MLHQSNRIKIKLECFTIPSNNFMIHDVWAILHKRIAKVFGKWFFPYFHKPLKI